MLKALALLARRGDALIVPSAVAPTATEPGACSSPRLPPCWCTPGAVDYVLGHGRCGCGFWRRSRAADSRCRSAGEICATGDRVVPWAADPSWDCDPTRIASSKGRRRQHARQDQPPPSMWLSSQRRRRSPSGCSGRLGGGGVPVSHVSAGCMAVRTMALPRRRRLSPRVHHITTTSPPPARRQPTHTRVELTCIFTAHTTHTQRTHVTACHTQPASTPMPVPQLTPFSCLRAALARQDLLAAHRGRRDPWFVLPAS